MKHIYIILLTVFLQTSCSEESPTIADKPLPPKGMAEVTLGEIRLSDADAAFGQEAYTATRATAANLTAGTTLRLYAFKKGVTDFNDKLSTRTYTINASGAAVPDAGQEPLYLPTGEVDIYLAGPLVRNIGTGGNPLWTDVAGETGIYPYQGVDLIATYTPATIQAGNTNPLPAMTLVHKMAKVQVVVSRDEKAAYENLVVKAIKLYAQSTSGTYMLDASGGAVTPDVASDFSYSQIAIETLHEKYSGTALLIPQPEKNLKIETTFECNQISVDVGDSHPTVLYRQSGLILTPLAAGTATRFTASPLTPIEIKWRIRLLPWNTVVQGDIIIPGLDSQLPPVLDGLILCLDGRSGTQTIDGVKYWMDLTGHNNAQITGTMTWTTDHFTLSSNANKMAMTNKMAMPNNFTCEVVLKSNGKQSGSPIAFTGAGNNYLGRYLWLHFPYSSGDVYVDSPAMDRYSLRWPQGVGEYSDVRQIAIRRQYKSKSEFFMYNKVVASGQANFDTEREICATMDIGGHDWQGDIYTIRIYNRPLTDAEMAANYQFDKRAYGFTDNK